MLAARVATMDKVSPFRSWSLDRNKPSDNRRDKTSSPVHTTAIRVIPLISGDIESACACDGHNHCISVRVRPINIIAATELFDFEPVDGQQLPQSIRCICAYEELFFGD